MKEMVESSTTASSFYEPPVLYDEEKTRVLYENLKVKFEDINKILKSIRKNFTNVEKSTTLTMKLLDKLESAELHLETSKINKNFKVKKRKYKKKTK